MGACSESPLDILFYSTHNEVERIFQRKMLSGTMTDMEWPSGKESDNEECPGQKPDWKNLWFDYEFDQSDTDSASLTNEEFLHMLDPASRAITSQLWRLGSGCGTRTWISPSPQFED